jgi:hopanoid biosynthesis associated radical SAM protein HpnH
LPVPVSQMYTVGSYVLKQRLRGSKRYPLVLMLEPLYRCNLACGGCGKIQYPPNVLKSQLSVDECMNAAEECPAPVVSVAGGEPLLHPQIGEIVAGLIERGKYVYLCTNGLLLEEKLDLFRPSRHLNLSVHLDGGEAEHDLSVGRPGTYRKACRAIREALARGFRVTTNTTLFEGADLERTRSFFDEMMRLGVEGMTISPGYAYERAPSQDGFLPRERTRELFRRLFADPRLRRWRFNHSPQFLEFLAGSRDYECTPWGNPTFGVFGWQRPCYLQQDGYEASFRELLENTRWECYGHASGNPHCSDCMVHSGFEASAVDQAFSSIRGMLQMIWASLLGPRIATAADPSPETREPTATIAPAATRGDACDATPEALRLAFQYRGNVTLCLADGDRIEGYVSNLHRDHLQLWRKGTASKSTIPVARIARIEFSGRDPASAESREVGRRYQQT